MADSTPDSTKHGSGEESTASWNAGAGAAASRAPEAPLERAEVSSGERRRSDRVVIAIPVTLSGTDLAGVLFTETCHTEMVSLHGASIVLARRVSSEHPVSLRRRGSDAAVQARILGQLDIRSGCHVYGISFTEDASDFWGITFPSIPETSDSLARTLLKCSTCGKKVVFALDEIAFRVFDANQRLSNPCETCGRTVLWLPVPHATEAAPTDPEDTALQDRKHTRTKMKAVACIEEPGGRAEIVPVLDISRGGISFHGTCTFEVNGWIHFAVPYTPGAANIFVAGRIAWRKELDDGHFEYGVQYVKG